MYECICGRSFSSSQSYNAHQGRCRLNRSSKGKPLVDTLNKNGLPWNKGLTVESDPRVRAATDKMTISLRNSEKVKQHCTEMVSHRNNESYKKTSETRKKKFLTGELLPPKGAGRGKYSYIRYGDKRIMLRSTYEFIYALYLLYNDIRFEYETVIVPAITDYKYARSFRSDFLIGNKIVEIKGYSSSKVGHAKLAFEAAGYEYEVKYWEDLLPCYEYLRSKIDIDSIIKSIRSGHDSKEYYEYKYGE